MRTVVAYKKEDTVGRTDRDEDAVETTEAWTESFSSTFPTYLQGRRCCIGQGIGYFRF